MKENAKEFIRQTKWMVANYKELPPYAKHHMIAIAVSSVSLLSAIITLITVTILNP